MFEIKFLVQNKKVGDALAAISPYSVGKAEPTFIKNHPGEEEVAQVRRTIPQEAAATVAPSPVNQHARKPVGKTLYDKVAAMLVEKNPPVITGTLLRSLTDKSGGSADSYTYVLTTLKKLGILSEQDETTGQYYFNMNAFKERMEGANG